MTNVCILTVQPLSMEGGWPGPGSGGLRSPRMRFRRDVVEDMKEGVHDVEEEIMDLEKKAEEELAPVAETLHVAPWSVQISLYSSVGLIIIFGHLTPGCS